ISKNNINSARAFFEQNSAYSQMNHQKEEQPREITTNHHHTSITNGSVSNGDANHFDTTSHQPHRNECVEEIDEAVEKDIELSQASAKQPDQSAEDESANDEFYSKIDYSNNQYVRNYCPDS